MNKKILVVGPYPPPFAGPEASIQMTLNSPLKDQYELLLFDTNFRRSNAEKGKPGWSFVLAFFQFTGGLMYRIIKHRPALIYYYVTATQIGWIFKDSWCIFITKLLGKKIVIHMRAGHFRDNYERMPAWAQRIIRFALQLTDFNLAQSPHLAQQYKGLVKEKGRIGYCYNMIDTQRFDNVDQNAYDPLTLLFLGHLSFAKGYVDILKVIPKIANHFPKVKFCFAGTKIRVERNVLHNPETGQALHLEDPERVFDTYIADQYEANYQYLGILGEEEKKKWLQKANCLLLPSYSEGFSMAILEGLSMGKPIICTDVGAMKDFIEDGKNGYKITAGDVVGLEKTILQLLNQPAQRNQIAKYNYKYCRAEFSQPIIAKKLGEVFGKVLQAEK